MAEIVNMGDQFRGLPMEVLIGGPLKAACDAQTMLANATAEFIDTVGLLHETTGTGESATTTTKTRTAKFIYTRPKEGAEPDKTTGIIPSEIVELEVPMLAIVKVPALSVKKVDITFDMEVKSSFAETNKIGTKIDTETSIGYKKFGFSSNVKINGSVSASKENTRSSDNSAKYHIAVLAEDDGMPEGLSRVLDMMQDAIAPKSMKAAA